MTGERKKLSFIYDKEKNGFVCELKLTEPMKNVEITKTLLLSENDMFFIQELIRVPLFEKKILKYRSFYKRMHCPI